MEQQKNTKKLKRLAITCGGTGGHFNPGLSIAQELNASGGEAILLLGGRHAEKQLKIAESGTRTRDLRITNALLYQLSYFGKVAKPYGSAHLCIKKSID